MTPASFQARLLASAGRAHALADERRGQVGGVAEEEHAPAAPTVGHLRAEHVVGDPDEAELLRRVSRVHGAMSRWMSHRLEVAEALTIEQPELQRYRRRPTKA